MIRILVTNIKGGCGKTTIATNLAGAFAHGGLSTALADVDRQRSSQEWLGLRPSEAAPIQSLDWRKSQDGLDESVQRLVIDAPANLRMKEVEDLIASADLVIVPVLPSLFDEGSTRRFMAKLDEVKPIRKGKKGVLMVANRLRARNRATQRLDAFLADLGVAPSARLADRALYAELAVQGLTVFDPPPGRRMAQNQQIREEWRPLLRAIEDEA